MTHDELLVRIKEKGSADFATLKHNPDGQKNIQEVFSALCAAVELHKPVSDGGCCGRDGDLVCDVCPDDQIREGHNAIYPCPTIQAIEKELG